MARGIVRWLVLGGGVLSGAGFTAMMLVMGYEVFARYVLGAPTYWALEVSTYLLVWATSLGLAYTLRCNAHVSVDLVVRMVSPATRRVLARIVMAVILVFAVVVVVYGTHDVLSAMRWNEVSLTPLAMPIAIPTAGIPAGAALLALQAGEFLIAPPAERDEEAAGP